jgi:hypothetical protein
MLPHFDERRRRLYLAGEAAAPGRGGIVRVAAASGTGTSTRGMAQLAGCCSPALRSRAFGGGLQAANGCRPCSAAGLGSLIGPHTEASRLPVAVTTRSLLAPASALTAQGRPVSAPAVGHLPHTPGYGLLTATQTAEGVSRPDRDVRFLCPYATAAAVLSDGTGPVAVGDPRGPAAGPGEATLPPSERNKAEHRRFGHITANLQGPPTSYRGVRESVIPLTSTAPTCPSSGRTQHGFWAAPGPRHAGTRIVRPHPETATRPDSCRGNPSLTVSDIRALGRTGDREGCRTAVSCRAGVRGQGRTGPACTQAVR